MRKTLFGGHLVLLFFALLFFFGLAFAENRPSGKKNPLAGKIIVVDPGHGGVDTGSFAGGVYEKNITLLLAHTVAQALQSQGSLVILTRETDTDLSSLVTPEQELAFTKEEYHRYTVEKRKIHALDKSIAQGTRYPPRYRLGLRARLELARKTQADVLLSIHTNRYQTAGPRGALTLYQEHCLESKLLAESIQHYLGAVVPGREKRDCVPDDFFILRNSTIPSVIVEVGFISNPRDRELMQTKEGQKLIAEALLLGLKDYFERLVN